MADTTQQYPVPAKSAASLLQAQDFAWLIFVAALIATTPETNYNATILLVLIGAFQIVEPRLKRFKSRRGQITSIVLKLLLSYLLVGYTHGIMSYYYSIFLIPVVSAATILDLAGVVLVTAIACAAYFSFWLLVPADYEVPPDQVTLMSLHVSFYAITAFLVYEQARAKREEMTRTEQAAASLAESNKNLREAQVSLRRTERLAALGQLTAGLAHELRNPLGTIKASAEMLTQPSIKDRPAVMAEMAEYIGSEVNRMNGLITSFLNFARPLQIQPVVADLRAVIDDVVRQQSDLAERREVTVRRQLAEGDWKFEFDPELMKVALSNLLQNAIQASDADKVVTLSAERAGTNVVLTVSDQGSGIQPQHLENIFNPFFTTKPEGVGLGLPIVSKIVDEHQGRIEVESDLGRGTRFRITLPQ
jgi:signal transduction histidine kinase